jgi:hypothetical protein
MSRFNVRPIALIPPLAEVIPHDKKPSAYHTMKHGITTASASASAPPQSSAPVEETKKGRPSKEDIRRRKLDMASSAIAELVESKPTRAKVRSYIEGRIAELDKEKR